MPTPKAEELVNRWKSDPELKEAHRVLGLFEGFTVNENSLVMMLPNPVSPNPPSKEDELKAVQNIKGLKSFFEEVSNHLQKDSSDGDYLSAELCLAFKHFEKFYDQLVLVDNNQKNKAIISLKDKWKTCRRGRIPLQRAIPGTTLG